MMCGFQAQCEPRVAVIVLNWNRWRDTVRCLESIFQSAYENFCVVLVDNGSSDGSAEKIGRWAEGGLAVESDYVGFRADNKPVPVAALSGRDAAGLASPRPAFPQRQLILVLNRKNLGFARGNNIGMRYAAQAVGAQYFMLLNNDTVIAPDCIRELVRSAEHDGGAGSFQPKMLAMEDPGTIDTAGIALHADVFAVAVGHGLPDGEGFSRRRDVFGACAGAALYRKDMLDQAGLFDEDFFAYYEDVDLAFRARRKGWGAVYVPGAVVYHCHSATLGKQAPMKTRFLERNRYYCIVKNAPKDFMLRFLKSRPGAIRSSLELMLRTRQYRHALAYARGNLEALAKLPKFFFKRLRARASGPAGDGDFLKWFSP